MKESCFLIPSQDASIVLFNFPLMTAITASYRHIKNTMKTFITKVGLCISLALKHFCNITVELQALSFQFILHKGKPIYDSL